MSKMLRQRHCPFVQRTKDNLVVRLWLACGIFSSLLYVVADVIGALNYPGYDYAGQAISEMSAIGAPTQELLAPFYLLYSILFALFAAGVWISAGRRRALRWSAGFMILLASLGIGWALFPMNMRGQPMALTDTMHLVMGAASTLVLFAILIAAAAAFGAWFRIYTIVTMLVMLVFGYLASLDIPRVAAGLPTPRLGLNERINFLAWLLWMAVLSVRLLRERSPAPGD